MGCLESWGGCELEGEGGWLIAEKNHSPTMPPMGRRTVKAIDGVF
jgi:hypothetical protein